jgi:hypothetical protein
MLNGKARMRTGCPRMLATWYSVFRAALKLGVLVWVMFTFIGWRDFV